MSNYKVYMHLFPNGKRYIGSTGTSVNQRWNNGKGYYFQSCIFDAICKYGWDNIKHYVLFSGLTKEEAEMIENALILKYKTHNRAFGYNSSYKAVPSDFVIPKFRKQIVSGKPNRTIGNEAHSANLRKAVYIVETGEEFESVSYASRCFMVTPAAIKSALINPHYTSCGYHWAYKEN